MQNDWIPGWATGWLWLTCTAAFVGICGTAAAAPPAPAPVKTFTYQTVDGANLQADIYRPDDAAPRPVLLWRHDGALLFGGKQDMAQDHVDLCRIEAKPTPGPAKSEPGR